MKAYEPDQAAEWMQPDPANVRFRESSPSRARSEMGAKPSIL
jgi:hypothetical protein